MDIVQYLHGLVSPVVAGDDDILADLLKQYYALSVCHVAQTQRQLSDVDAVGLWGDKTQALIQRLSRSFHVPPQTVLMWLNQATPAMMGELRGLTSHQSLPQVLSGQGVNVLYLPAWAGEFIHEAFVDTHTITEAPTAQPSAVDEEVADINPQDVSLLTTKPTAKPKKINFVVWGLGLLAIGALVGGGMVLWDLYQSKKSSVSTTDTVVSSSSSVLNPPRVLLTTGEQGSLYGCLAEVGDNALQVQLVQILQKNFGQVDCIMDVDTSFGSSLAGLERLDSIIAMMKAEPFTSIEIVGAQIVVNHPQTDTLNRLVGDIGLLAPQFKVSAVAPLDKNSAVNDSIHKATNALNALAEGSSPYQLARAINLQQLDFYGVSQMPEVYHAPLTLFAKHLINHPTTKFIIASHTDNANPSAQASMELSQAQAQVVKDFLVAQGVPEAQLIAKGVGGAFPIADNLTEVGRFKNRRVEFLVHDEAMMALLTDKANRALSPKTNERPQMVESAPYVPATNELVATAPQPMAVQGMPPTMLPEPVRTEPTPAPVAQNQAPPQLTNSVSVDDTYMFDGVPQAGASAPVSNPTAPAQAPTSTIPKEVLELSQTAIGSDGVIKGESYEIRR